MQPPLSLLSLSPSPSPSPSSTPLSQLVCDTICNIGNLIQYRNPTEIVFHFIPLLLLLCIAHLAANCVNFLNPPLPLPPSPPPSIVSGKLKRKFDFVNAIVEGK